MINKEKLAPFYTPISIIVGSIIIAGSILGSGWHSSAKPAVNVQAQNQQPTAKAAVDISKVKITGEPYVGNANAPVTVAYWYDYQCPFCQRNEQTSMAQLMDEYVKPGKVKIVYKDFAFLGADSVTAALASHAVWELAPAKFSAWHKAMFDAQGKENSGWASKANILALTAKISGIDATQVGQLMTTNAAKYQAEMDADKSEGAGFGITGTPGFIIGKKLIVGAQPYTQIKAAIDTALAGK